MKLPQPNAPGHTNCWCEACGRARDARKDAIRALARGRFMGEAELRRKGIVTDG